MSLQPVLDSLDGVDENLAQYYVEQDGKYRLNVEGGFKTNDEIGSLTKALNSERESRSKLEKQLKKFEGIDDPAEAKKALETMANLDQKKLIDAGEVEKVKAEVQKAMQGKIDELEQQVQQKESTLRNELIGGRFARSKFLSEKVAAPPDLIEAKFKDSFTVEEGKVVAKDQHGNPIYSKDKPGELADFDEALGLLIEQYPNRDIIMKKPTGSGAPGSRGQHTGNEDWHKLPPEERLASARKQAASQK